MSRPFVLGVTGGIASGKSAVLAMLGARGVETVDADLVYRELIATGGVLVQTLVEAFGEGVQAGDGSIDRAALGRIVFADRRALMRLDRLTHPAILAAIRARIKMSTAAVVAVDAIKLIESKMDRECDQIWLVTCDLTIQRQRLMARNGITAEEAEGRLEGGPDMARALQVADVVFDNSLDLAHLETQVDAAWQVVQLLSK
jgi:dephospho-CoA kinase